VSAARQFDVLDYLCGGHQAVKLAAGLCRRDWLSLPIIQTLGPNVWTFRALGTLALIYGFARH
jgi:hypothetical protein